METGPAIFLAVLCSKQGGGGPKTSWGLRAWPPGHQGWVTMLVGGCEHRPVEPLVGDAWHSSRREARRSRLVKGTELCPSGPSPVRAVSFLRWKRSTQSCVSSANFCLPFSISVHGLVTRGRCELGPRTDQPCRPLTGPLQRRAGVVGVGGLTAAPCFGADACVARNAGPPAQRRCRQLLACAALLFVHPAVCRGHLGSWQKHTGQKRPDQTPCFCGPGTCILDSLCPMPVR